jgi:hypothetical protein
MNYEDDAPVIGEVPGDQTLMYGPAIEFFDSRSQTSNGRIADGHELATKIENDIVSLDDLTIEPSGDNRTFTARHKKGLEIVVITLTVAGVLAAAKQIRTRHKK